MSKLFHISMAILLGASVAFGMTLRSSDGVVKIINTPSVVAYSSSIAINFSGATELWTVIEGDVTLLSSSLGAGLGVVYRIDNGTSTNCNVILPAAWRKVSGTTTNILASGSIGILAVKSYDSNDTNVICTWASE